MRVTNLDHLVLTVADIDTTTSFYERVLRMESIVFGNGRRALRFGEQKLNLHAEGHEFAPKAAHPLAGSADLCFRLDGTLEAAIDHLHAERVPIEHGPVVRSGALGPIRSVYFRDPDGNLIEVAEQLPDE
jgi:catechol 2,3-dioxygenase-like lactoylglutathione lyase family enzyme